MAESTDTDIIVEPNILEVAANETISLEEVCDDSVSDNCNLVNENEQDITFRSSKTQTSSLPMFSIENFRHDDAGVHFYTGLENFVKFMFVLTTLGPAAHCLNYAYNQVLNINVPDQFFLVLMKLRRNTTNFELSRFFEVSESTVNFFFLTWICFMSKQWHEINIWRSQELVHYFSPSGFRTHHPSTRVIIDGTEFQIRKPNNPTSQQATFSTYKNKNTVKVLVGASPGGLISFISGAYGGTTSDRQIVERSGLIQMCDPYDSVMADKGFNVQYLFAPHDVTVNIPSFFKKKNRMNCGTVMKDRKIASKRVHFERLIGLGKTFTILQNPMTATET